MLEVLLAIITAGAAIAIVLLGVSRRRHREAAARWAVTSQVSVVLAEALDVNDVLTDVLRLMVPHFADWCILHLADEQGGVRRAALVHADPKIEAELHVLQARSPFEADARHGPAHVIRTGEPELIRRVTPDVLASQSDNARHMLRDVAKMRSVVIVPLKARQQTLGSLTLARGVDDGYDTDDLGWAQDLGHRIGLAVENARLYSEARHLFEETVSANFVSTPAGKILACNETFARLIGYDSIDEVLATDARNLYARPDDRIRFLDKLRQHRRILGFESTIKRRDGQLVYTLEDAVGTFNDRGELVKITGFVIDRTAQKQLEEQLRLSQRLEAVGQLAGGIAHDFNNLLTVIIGCTDLLHSDRPPVPSLPDGHDPLDELTKAAKRAAALTQQLLAFSRRQVLQPRVVDLNDALRSVHSMLRRLVRDNIVVILDLAQDIDRVRVDPGQLDQVVVNLVVNAGDAMPAGGTLTLRTAVCALTELDVAQYPYVIPGRYVCLAVGDTGVGMDEATRVRAFEPFFTTKPVGKGTGLGLSTVYGIVKQSGGYVWVKSAPDAGTTVSVYLPAVGA